MKSYHMVHVQHIYTLLFFFGGGFNGSGIKVLWWIPLATRSRDERMLSRYIYSLYNQKHDSMIQDVDPQFVHLVTYYGGTTNYAKPQCEQQTTDLSPVLPLQIVYKYRIMR
eukprot:512744_1